jgi:hypothetical protein
MRDLPALVDDLLLRPRTNQYIFQINLLGDSSLLPLALILTVFQSDLDGKSASGLVLIIGGLTITVDIFILKWANRLERRILYVKQGPELK